jgi:acyl dehydratase
MLLVSIANGLYNRIGITDETGMALTGIEWRFLAPGFIGDTVHLVAAVQEKRKVSKKDRGLVFWDARLLKQDGTTMCQGQMIRMVRRRRDGCGSDAL